LTKDPLQRPTAAQMLAHPWIRDNLSWTPPDDFDNIVSVVYACVCVHSNGHACVPNCSQDKYTHIQHKIHTIARMCIFGSDIHVHTHFLTLMVCTNRRASHYFDSEDEHRQCGATLSDSDNEHRQLTV